MADQLLGIKRFKDMGDGTWAEVVYTGGSASGGDASAANQETANGLLASIDASLNNVENDNIEAGTEDDLSLDIITVENIRGAMFNSLDLDETEEDVKTSAGTLYGFSISNHRTTSPVYIRFYNATAANTTVGTTAAFAGPFTVPAAVSSILPTVRQLTLPRPLRFTTAICVAATTGPSAADTGAPAANEVIANVSYS